MDKMEIYKKAAREFADVTKIFDSLKDSKETERTMVLIDEIIKAKKEIADLKERLKQEQEKVEGSK